MSEYIDKDTAVGEGYLQDWYIESVVGGAEPVWTEAHIEELANDFIVIPKDTPATDVAPVVHARWEPFRGVFQCSACGFGMFMDGVFFENGECTHANEQNFRLKYCPNCGAKMDGGDTDV